LGLLDLLENGQASILIVAVSPVLQEYVVVPKAEMKGYPK